MLEKEEITSELAPNPLVEMVGITSVFRPRNTVLSTHLTTTPQPENRNCNTANRNSDRNTAAQTKTS